MENQTEEKEEAVTAGFVNWDQLVSDFRNKQDDVSFEALYRSSYSKLYGYLYTLGHNKELAEDAIQNGFLTCYTKIDQLADGARFIPWMKQICYHEYLAMARKQGRTVSLVAETADGEEYDLSDIPDDGSIGIPESGIEQEELQKLLQQALDSLPELQRISLISFYYDKKAIHSIADELGVPENTVKTYLSRGRRNMNHQVRSHATAYGLKLVPVAIVPVIAELLKTEVQACELSVTGGMINASLASVLAVGAAKGTSGAVVSGAAGSVGADAFGTAAGTASAAGTGASVSGVAGTAAASATKAVSVKIVAGLTAAALAGGGAVAVVHSQRAAKEEPAAVSTVQETAETAATEATVAEEDEEIKDEVIQAYITYLENREYGEDDYYEYTFAHIDDDATPELIEMNESLTVTPYFEVLTVRDNEVVPFSYLPDESETAYMEEFDYHPFFMESSYAYYYPGKNRILLDGSGGVITGYGVDVNPFWFETFQNDGDGFYRDVNAEINTDFSSTGFVMADGESVPTDMAFTFSINGRPATQEEYETLYNQMGQYEGVNGVSFYQSYDRDVLLEILKNDYVSLDTEVLGHENTDTMEMLNFVIYQGEGVDDSAKTEEAVAADYQEVIDVIKNCGDVPYDSDAAAQHEDYFPMALHYDKGTPGYILMDLNGDGTEELLLTEGSAVDSARFESMDVMDRVLSGIYIYAVLTVKDGQVVPVVSQGGVRDAYYLCEDGMIGRYSSGGASLWGYAFYKFDGKAFTLQECIFHDTLSDMPVTEEEMNDVRCFYTTAAPFVDKGTEISQDDFDAILNKHSCIALSPTPIL